jgi:hypothetical protein
VEVDIYHDHHDELPRAVAKTATQTTEQETPRKVANQIGNQGAGY